MVQFSQKTNGLICFPTLTTQKYWKLEFRYQVSSFSKSLVYKNKFIPLFFGRSYGSTILFRDLLTFTLFNKWQNKIHMSYGGCTTMARFRNCNTARHVFQYRIGPSSTAPETYRIRKKYTFLSKSQRPLGTLLQY